MASKPVALLQQQQEHNIELMCRICAADFKIATEGVPIFSTEQLMDKIKNYLHIQVNINRYKFTIIYLGKSLLFDSNT